MVELNLGILGATGAVGEMMLKVLEERNIKIGKLKLFASKNSSGKKLFFQGREIVVEEADESSFKDLDVVLGATSSELSKVYAKTIVKSKALFIDNSSAFRNNPQVPLIIPTINDDEIKNHNGIISNPNCATIIALLAIFPIHQINPIQKMIVSTYQAVSGAGKAAINELEAQMKHYVERNYCSPKVFKKPICNNVIPLIGELNDLQISSEEMKMQTEARKILNDKKIRISCTCVRVPIIQCHSESIYVETNKKIIIEDVIKNIKDKSNCIYDESIATPIEYTNQDKVAISRLRLDQNDENSCQLWCCGDQLRIGAATNAINILEIWMKNSHKVQIENTKISN